jgi:hypothetical protein
MKILKEEYNIKQNTADALLGENTLKRSLFNKAYFQNCLATFSINEQ